MGWSINLMDPGTGEIMKVKSHREGSNICVQGCNLASISVTFNYSWFYYKFFDKKNGLRFINKKTAKECIPLFKKFLKDMGNVAPFENYWAPTPGNAAHIIKVLLEWAKQYPEAIFEIC